jgi:hypothetical protein
MNSHFERKLEFRGVALRVDIGGIDEVDPGIQSGTAGQLHSMTVHISKVNLVRLRNRLEQPGLHLSVKLIPRV